MPTHAEPAPASVRAPRFAAPLLIAAATALVVLPFLFATLRRVGTLEFPLDDTYIYLQYARQLAHGRGFEYFPGAGYSTGCTSVLYPLLLVPGFWLGLDGVRMLPYVWVLSALLVLGCAAVAARTGRRVAGLPGAACAAALLLVNGAWLWGALAGLEIATFTLLALLAVDLTFAEHEPVAARPRGGALWITCALLALARPEGMLVATLAIGAALLSPARRNAASIAAWFAALLPCLLVGLVNHHFTGTFAPNTAVAKSVALLPRQTLRGVAWNALHELAVLGMALVRGWNGLALYPLGAVLAVPALLWLGACPVTDRRRFGPLPWLVLLGGIGVSLASALSARWPGQFFRYAHPALGLLALAGGLALGTLVRASGRSSTRAVRVAVPGALALVLAAVTAQQLPRWCAAFARAAWEIHHQQVAAAGWIAAHLPPRDRLLMNDVGAMAYLPQRPIFDVCGLVTNHQARVWAEGTGALYEKLERIAPSERADHLVVYADWFALPPLLGRTLHEETLAGPLTVAGGRTAVVVEPNWSWLGRGDRPGAQDDALIADAVDVADLDDEAAHAYAFRPPAHAPRAAPGTIVRFGRDARGDSIGEGGRLVGRGETFVLRLPRAGEATLIARLADAPTLDVVLDGRPVGALTPAGGADFAEPALALGRAQLAAGPHRVEIRAAGSRPYGSYHYWLVLAPTSEH